MLAGRAFKPHILGMLKLTPILLAVLYALAMYHFSVWRTKRDLDSRSTELADPRISALTKRMAQALDSQSEQDQLLLRLGTAVGKYWICKRTPQHAYEAMECIGGNGVMENCIMPRLYREAPVNAIWEGSGNIQALDVRRAMSRSPEVVDAWMAELLSTARQDPRQDALVENLKQELAGADEGSARRLVELLALSIQGSLLLRGGNAAIAEAFLAGRCESPSHHFGTLPAGLDLNLLINRANPHCYDS